MNGDSKILLKIFNPDTRSPYWVHLCYADKEIYDKYMLQNHSESMNLILSRWIEEDFGKVLEINSAEDIATLKSLVKEFYKHKYPDIYRDSNIDRQGWMRLWITSKMKEELKDGKISK